MAGSEHLDDLTVILDSLLEALKVATPLILLPDKTEILPKIWKYFVGSVQRLAVIMAVMDIG